MHQSAKVLLEARRDKKEGEKRKKEKGRRKMTKKREKVRERKKVWKEREGKEMCRLDRSRFQAAPTPETSHGFRGSAGLKGITLS